jgi:aquaporin Z
MNPGVSLLMFLKRKISLVKMLCYWASQFSGAVVASLLVWGCTSGLTEAFPAECAASGRNGVDCGAIGNPPFGLGATTLDPALSLGNGFLLELMGSIVFYFVIAQTALDQRGIANTGFPALPIGLVLIVVHICLIPFTGCGVNPARTFGPFLVNCFAGECAAEMEWFWIYYVGPAAAAVIVAEITAYMEDDAVAEGEKNRKEMTDDHL